MATFRSKEDSAKDQVPLHRFQERIGAFRAIIHMIANRGSSELRTLERLQASLHQLVSLFSPLAKINTALIWGTIRRRKSMKEYQMQKSMRIGRSRRESENSSPTLTSFQQFRSLLLAWLNDKLPSSKIYTAYMRQVTEPELKNTRKDAHSGGTPFTRMLLQSLSSQKAPSRYGRMHWTLLTKWFGRGNLSLTKSRI